MNAIKRRLKSALKNVYYRLARPLQARFREELRAAETRFSEQHAEQRAHGTLVSERVFAELRQAGMQGRAELQRVATGCHQQHAAMRQELDSEKEKLWTELRQLRTELAVVTAEVTRARQEAVEARKVPTEVWDELARMSQCYLQFHSAQRRQVADENIRITRTLETGGADSTARPSPSTAAAA